MIEYFRSKCLPRYLTVREILDEHIAQKTSVMHGR